jgi:hypothetical protein
MRIVIGQKGEVMSDSISRQDTINDLISRKWLMEIFENYPFDTEKDKNRVIHVVRDTAPSVEPEQKTKKLIEEINKMDRLYLNIQDGEIRVLPYDNVIRIIQRTESERKVGKWILSDAQRREDIENGNYQYFCSNCLYSDIHAKTVTVPFCWHCGAKMEDEE